MSKDKLSIAALALAAKGFHVFPCEPRGKAPVTCHGFKDATIDEEVINDCWGLIPEANVAIATGKVSGLFVLDIDGDDGEQSMRQLEAEHGKLPETVEVITGDGRHVYFRYCGDMRNRAGIFPGIDVRGDGGYVIVPPSVHETGRRYEWSVDSANTIADCPDWLLTLLAEKRSSTGAHPLAAEIANGSRNHTMASLVGRLLRAGIPVAMARSAAHAINDNHCKPPLDATEVDAVVVSITRSELRRLGGGDE